MALSDDIYSRLKHQSAQKHPESPPKQSMSDDAFGAAPAVPAETPVEDPFGAPEAAPDAADGFGAGDSFGDAPPAAPEADAAADAFGAAPAAPAEAAAEYAPMEEPAAAPAEEDFGAAAPAQDDFAAAAPAEPEPAMVAAPEPMAAPAAMAMPEIPESNKLTEWEAAWAVELAAKDAEGQSVTAAAIEKATADLEQFNLEREKTKESKQEKNRTLEAAMQEQMEADLESANPFERVVKLVDIEAKQDKSSGASDLSRMRSVFVQLKNEPLTSA